MSVARDESLGPRRCSAWPVVLRPGGSRCSGARWRCCSGWPASLLPSLYSLPRVQLARPAASASSASAFAFGLLPVCGAAWLQSGIVDWPAVLVALPTGTVGHADPADQFGAPSQGGRRERQAHMVVRLGHDGSRRLYQAAARAASPALLARPATKSMPWRVAAGALVVLAGGIKAATGIRERVRSRPALTKSIEMTLRPAGGRLGAADSRIAVRGVRRSISPGRCRSAWRMTSCRTIRRWPPGARTPHEPPEIHPERHRGWSSPQPPGSRRGQAREIPPDMRILRKARQASHSDASPRGLK